MSSGGLYCPYCGEWIEIYVDPGGATRQDYIEDCSVCCRPIRIQARLDHESGEADIVGSAEDD